MTTDEKLRIAIHLRESGKFLDANKMLVELAEAHGENPYINYQCAWSFDSLGEEAKAVPYYKKAIEYNLEKDDLADAYLGLGSTLRALGEYDKSQEVFEEAKAIFPENNPLKVFYSMTLYNLGRHKEAMEILLCAIGETTMDPELKKYKRAILLYSNRLDDIEK